MRMPLKRVTVTLPDPLVSELETLRQTERISVSSVAEVALRAYLGAHARHAAGETLRAAGATLRRRHDATSQAASISPPAAKAITGSPDYEEGL